MAGPEIMKLGNSMRAKHYLKAGIGQTFALGALALGGTLVFGADLAEAKAPDPVSILPAPQPATQKPNAQKPAAPTPGAPTPGVAQPGAAAAPAPPASTSPVIPIIPPELPPAPLVMNWNLGDARALLGVVVGLEAEGLIPADYELAALRAAIAAGEGEGLDIQASRSFSWLAEDLRDGRTRMESRTQWFAVDHDVEQAPTEALMARALEGHDVVGVLAGLAPTNPDYAALKGALAAMPRADRKTRDLIRVNMDRWRWLSREMGPFYLITNVPEFQLRLTVRNEIIRSYRTIVGKPGKTATPQLAEVVQGVIFNPTWTVPQSIVKGEGLGAQLLANPARARRENYKVTKAENGMVTVVQQPGPGNSLGLMKLDMPNPHAIFVHDTPSRRLFNLDARALSHGCIRTERASELGMTMAILGAGMTPEEGIAHSTSRKYTLVPMTRTFPIYITYFTMATDVSGKMRAFNDLYQRDAPVLTSFAAPRKLQDGQRTSKEAIIKLDNPL